MDMLIGYFIGVLAGLAVGIFAAYEANGWETPKWKQWRNRSKSSKL